MQLVGSMISSNVISQEVAKVPRVSIGLPVYNGAKYLADAIDSLLVQTFGDFELIISDNGSTDSTPAICEAYAARDRRIRYIRQEINRGLAWNWNRVFEESCGAYFKWAACDDLYHPTFLERCVQILDQYPDVAWCHTLSRHVDPNGKPFASDETAVISHVNSGQGPTSCSRTSDQPSTRFKAVLLGDNGLDSYGLMRSQTLRTTACYLPYYGSEKVLAAELALRGRYHEIPEILYFARIHEAAAGNLHTSRDQRHLINPFKKKWQFDRLGLLRGHFAAVQRAQLPLAERIRCYAAIGRYLLQVRKWKSVLKKAIKGAGLAAEYPAVTAPSTAGPSTARYVAQL
jgi:glycosyltransferase involved in cell wall biosynthesis